MFKYLKLIIGILLIIGIVFFVIVFANQDGKLNKNSFVQLNAYVAMEEGTSTLFDLAYFTNKNKEDKFKKNNIKSITFNNLEDFISIADIDIMDGEPTDKYKITTLSINAKFNKAGIKKAKELKITYKDGKSEIYKIGDWKFDVGTKKKVGKHLTISDNYPFLASGLDYYSVDFKNKSTETLVIDEIEIDLPKVKFKKFSPIQLEAGKIISDTLEADKEDYFNCYLIKPRIKYTCKNKKYEFYPNSSINYGYLDMTNERIENELNKLN